MTQDLKRPKLSVIVSIFNGEKFLKGFLENVLEQEGLEDYEILLLDAKSTDQSAKIISGFKHPSLKYVNLGQKFSIYETWNLGVDQAKADVLSNWNVDDRRSPNGLAVQLQGLESSGADVCYGYTAWSYVENERFADNDRLNLYPCEIVTFDSMLGNNSPHCMPIWRKDLHNRFGYFDPTYPTAADFDFWMRCLAGGATFKKIHNIVGLYYYNPSGLSTSAQSSNMREGAAIKKKFIEQRNLTTHINGIHRLDSSS